MNPGTAGGFLGVGASTTASEVAGVVGVGTGVVGLGVGASPEPGVPTAEIEGGEEAPGVVREPSEDSPPGVS